MHVDVEKRAFWSQYFLRLPCAISKRSQLQNLEWEAVRKEVKHHESEVFNSSGDMFFRRCLAHLPIPPVTSGHVGILTLLTFTLSCLLRSAAFSLAHLNTHTCPHTYRHVWCSSERKLERTEWDKSKCQAGGSLWNMTGNTVSLAKRFASAMILINGFSDPAEISILIQDDILSSYWLPWHKWHLMTLPFSV